MSDTQGPPRRRSSQELTAVIPRERLPPPSIRNLEELDLDPEHPETRELFERARAAEHELRTRPTMVPCPAGCRQCSCCSGTGCVTKDQDDEWRRQHHDKGVPPDAA